ncbi:hypothetical protein DRO26_03285, partial [Candidatus Bathyarchaeota archaeon]
KTLNFGSENFSLTKPSDLRKKIVKISSLNDYIQVVGVDVSCRRVGNTKEGVLCALRGTVVWKNEYAYQYNRYGPFLFHLTVEVEKTSEENELDINQPRLSFNENPNSMVGKVQIFVEKNIQRYVCKNLKNSIILLDGCLSVQNIDQETLNLARRNGNKVLAFTKKSEIRVNGEPITSLLKDETPPCILHLDEFLPYDFCQTRLGWVFVVKLAEGSLGFRLDVDKGLPIEEAIKTIQRLLGNELVVQGYPETLRIAHTLSIFTNLEILAIQRFLSKKYNLKIQKPRNVRRMLFGPFGQWVDD